VKNLPPIALHEILDIRAGCIKSISANSEKYLDIDMNEIWKEAQLDNKNCGQFVTLIATATPATPARYFYLKFKNRGERNDSLCGLRKLIADIQIFDGGERVLATSPFRGGGAGRSSSENVVENKKESKTPIKTTVVYGAGGQKDAKKMVLLEDVKKQLSKERTNYERIMVQLLQSMSDMHGKENEVESLMERLEIEEKKHDSKKKGNKEVSEHD